MTAGELHLVSELERLLKIPTGGSDLKREAWCEEADGVKQVLRERFPRLVYPREILEFLDTGANAEYGEDYRQYQEQLVRDFIKRVRDDIIA